MLSFGNTIVCLHIVGTGLLVVKSAEHNWCSLRQTFIFIYLFTLAAGDVPEGKSVFELAIIMDCFFLDYYLLYKSISLWKQLFIRFCMPLEWQTQTFCWYTRISIQIQFKKSLLPQITSTSTTYIHAGILRQRGASKQKELIGPSMGCEHN